MKQIFSTTHEKSMRANLRNITLIALGMVFSLPADAGWFGYETWEECMAQEPGKLMTRWINPLPPQQAKQAAREVCRQYPTRWSIQYSLEFSETIRGFTLTELVQQAESCKDLKQTIQKIRREKNIAPWEPSHPGDWSPIHSSDSCEQMRTELERRGLIGR